MANSELKFKSVVLDKEQPLGVGSYGSVFQAYCDDLVCAAKILHPTLVQTNTSISVDKLHRLPMKRFEAECAFLKELHHPNIIQYLGMYEDNETGLPVLLMELMDESLTHYLESEPEKSISHTTQLRLCQDIVTALSFLHSNNIVHRDLSSNNILLIGRYRAKLSDFGMATLLSNRGSQISNTLCPGTDVYMPPEAIEKTATFTAKGDIFSFGINMIQILTHKFPAPGDRFKTLQIDHPEIPQGSLEVRVSEKERRKAHINSIEPSHPLLPSALECIKDQPTDRPTASELCKTFCILKSSPLTKTSPLLEKEPTSPPYQDTEPAAAEYKNVENPKHIKIEEMLQTPIKETTTDEKTSSKPPAPQPHVNKPPPSPHAKKPPLLTKPSSPLRVQQTADKPQPPPRANKPHSPMYVNKPPLHQNNEQLYSNEPTHTNEVDSLHTYQQLHSKELPSTYDELYKNESPYTNQLPDTDDKNELLYANEQTTSQHSKKHSRNKSAPPVRTKKSPPLYLNTNEPPSPTYVNILHSFIKLDSSLNTSKPVYAYNDELPSPSHAKMPPSSPKSAPLLFDYKPAPQQMPKHITRNNQPPKQRVGARKSAPPSLILKIQNSQPPPATSPKEEFLPAPNERLARSSKVIKKNATSLTKVKPVPKPKIQPPLPTVYPISITWQRERNAPTVMSKDTDAVVNGNTVYLRPRRTRKIYSYVSTTSQWSKHIDCLTDNTTLAIVENGLTTVGGTHSNKLYTLPQTGDKKCWIEIYPSMNTERARCTAISSDSTLIVIGGLTMNSSGSQDIQSVEILNTDEKQWTTAIDIPQPLHACSGQIVDDTLYLLGGLNTFNASKTVYYCSVVDLLTSCRSSPFRAKFAARFSSTMWSTIRDMPVTEATCIKYNNHLIAIGGRDEKNIPTDSVYAYDKQKNIWHKIDSLNNPRTLCFASVLQNDSILVIGGIAPPTKFGDVSIENVELGIINKL